MREAAGAARRVCAVGERDVSGGATARGRLGISERMRAVCNETKRCTAADEPVLSTDAAVSRRCRKETLGVSTALQKRIPAYARTTGLQLIVPKRLCHLQAADETEGRPSE